MEDSYSQPVLDAHGNVMFRCSQCDGPITRSDVLDLGLRLPDYGEACDDYMDAELVDSFRHPRCLETRAG